VDRFGRKILAWASLELEAHRMDTMSHTSDDDGSLWRLDRHLGVLGMCYILCMSSSV
jgi:hypothetical protein